MLDHVLGRPSVKSRRLQVLAVLVFWTAYLVRGNKNGPPGTRRLSRLLSRKLTAWQVVLVTMTYLYAARNFSTLVGLASPDPLTNMYDATFFRATWVLTALDAGFWTAMKIRSRWLRNLASIVFSGFYLLAAEQADDKVRKVRGNLTVEHLRVSWNKGTTPYLSFIQGLTRPRLTRWPPRRVRIPRPGTGTTSTQPPIMAWLYYDGALDELRMSGTHRMVLDIPGGGFVAMDPRCNDDRLLAWAVQTGLPVLSIDYGKAPEHPFPYALWECRDVYAMLVQTRGRCIGMSGQEALQIVVTGDSAGGNLATAMTLMIAREAEAGAADGGKAGLPMPQGLVLVYPSLDMNIGSWMSDEQMALIQDRRMRATNRNVMRRKTREYSDIAGTPHESDDELAMTGLGEVGGAVQVDENREANKAGQVVTTNEADQTDETNEVDARLPKPAYSHVNLATYRQSSRAMAVPTTPTTTRTTPMIPATTTVQTRLATSSTISYFNDRVLTPEMMRAMIILYVGPHNRPDFSRDYLLSPILAPDALLARFPKTYFLTGERDPLVDDTVIFAGRLRRIQAARRASGGRRLEYRDADAAVLASMAGGFDDRDVAEVVLVPGVSHGFLQFPAIYPPAWIWLERVGGWIEDTFRAGGDGEVAQEGKTSKTSKTSRTNKTNKMNKTNETGETGETTSKRGAQKQRADRAGRAGRASQTDRARIRTALVRAESSGDESPLEMMRMTKADSASGASVAEDALPRRPPRRGDKGDALAKLASSDDLLGRRMQGIVGGLSRMPED